MTEGAYVEEIMNLADMLEEVERTIDALDNNIGTETPSPSEEQRIALYNRTVALLGDMARLTATLKEMRGQGGNKTDGYWMDCSRQTTIHCLVLTSNGCMLP